MADYTDYEGEYEIVPKIHEKITLPTANKKLTSNIRVKQVTYTIERNESGGETLTILGGE